MSHACHYPHCGTPTPPRLLFCASHWAMVPPAIQSRVYSTFRAAPDRDRRARDVPYLTACAEAVEAVGTKLGVVGPERNVYRRILKSLAEIEANKVHRRSNGNG